MAESISLAWLSGQRSNPGELKSSIKSIVSEQSLRAGLCCSLVATDHTVFPGMSTALLAELGAIGQMSSS